jgi:hypothetical protein
VSRVCPVASVGRHLPPRLPAGGGPGRAARPGSAWPHDLRHTFATWLEDGGVPARVLDELMGHQAGRRGEHEGSMIGTRYRGDASRSSPPPRSGCRAGRPAAGRLPVPSRGQAHRVVVTLAGSSGLPPVFTAGSRVYAAFGGVTATHSVSGKSLANGGSEPSEHARGAAPSPRWRAARPSAWPHTRSAAGRSPARR